MRILQVVHGFPPEASAGTEVYVRNLSRALAGDPANTVCVFTREADPARPELALRTQDADGVRRVAVNNTFQSCATYEESYANAPIERIASNLLDEWRPDVVHVQHLTCLSTGIPREAKRRGIPVVMTLNDYWLICHRGQLVDLRGERCSGPFDEGCAHCIEPAALARNAVIRVGRSVRAVNIPAIPAVLRSAVGLVNAAAPASLARAASLDRLRHMQHAVRDVDVFLAPSDTLLRQFLRFGIPPERLQRCEQGVPLPSTPRRTGSSKPLRVGFAGGFQPTKGLGVLLDALETLPDGSITLDVFGAAAPYHGDAEHLTELQSRLGHPAIRRLGPVPPERMSSCLAALDVLVVPSVWLENAPFIIREAFACGLPVIASNLGGMAEMVVHRRNGLLFDAGDAVSLASQIRALIDDAKLLEVLRSGIVRPMSIEEDAARLQRIYGRVAEGTARREGRPAPPVRHPGQVCAVVLNYNTPEQTTVAVRSLQTSFSRPAVIEVVDNGSGDDSIAVLTRSLAGVRVTSLPRNVGFSAGSNAGIRAALDGGAEYVLLVNSDVVLRPDAIDHLLAAVLLNRVGIAGPVLLSREEPDRIASAGIAFSPRTGRMRHRGAGSRLSALPPAPFHRVDAISGCVMLIRRGVFERAGLLDDSYFFSFEDVEFCLRARRAGFDTVCVPEAIAYHEGGRTIGRRSPRRVYFATRNHLRLAAETGPSAVRTLRAAAVLGFNAAYVLLSPEAPLFGGTAALLRGAWHHLSGRYGAD